MSASSETGTRRWLAGSFPAASLAFALGCIPSSVDTQPRSVPAVDAAGSNPTVANLLEFNAEGQAPAEFVRCLEELSKKQGWQQQYAECKRRSILGWTQARAVSIRAGEDQYAVVLLNSGPFSIPGLELQEAILLDGQGKFLDQLACEISSRATQFSGQFHTVVLGNAGADGAQLVMRLDGASARGHLEHRIYHGGGMVKFYWGQNHVPAEQPTKWDAKGLCRLAIRGGKFKVLFPQEGDGEQPPDFLVPM
jgi:hypothetical protein